MKRFAQILGLTAAGLSVGGCLLVEDDIPPIPLTAQAPELGISQVARDFEYHAGQSRFLTAGGVWVEQALSEFQSQGGRHVHVLARTERAAEYMAGLQTVFPALTLTVEERPISEDKERVTGAELVMTLNRYLLQVPDCVMGDRRRPLGCAVERNRALSLVDPAELHGGRPVPAGEGGSFVLSLFPPEKAQAEGISPAPEKGGGNE
ncbi:hypothetical protein [Sneathiella chinensis]|uniref:Uncharacterized protein n=1 Tax=Sneathiella chinensis TaxID=349750 RepID=A0ABQ5U4R8_9PROT|nr:hypothetical protein [Sneathiella chinensis]GLQ06665.1 hypothetical protein GCM10007924_18860 [Sneathiella chinensis]